MEFETPAPDPYYLQIKNIQLAVPKAYVDAGISGFEVAGNRNQVRSAATRPPGLQVDFFQTIVNSSDATPSPKDQKRQGIPDLIYVQLSIPRNISKEVAARAAEWYSATHRRSQSHDAYGLTAYESGRGFPEGDLHFTVQLEDSETLSIKCGGFTLPNPTCRANTSLHDLVLEYDFRYIYISEWRKIHARVKGLLDSFVYPSAARK